MFVIQLVFNPLLDYVERRNGLLKHWQPIKRSRDQPIKRLRDIKLEGHLESADVCQGLWCAKAHGVPRPADVKPRKVSQH